MKNYNDIILAENQMYVRSAAKRCDIFNLRFILLILFILIVHLTLSLLYLLQVIFHVDTLKNNYAL